ncbi:MAG TPA: SMC family ATPase [Streptosporangiaceae bacterium]|jgi:exonuclease SbcC
MLPLLLRLENFGSFRRPTEIDFTDADYFALVGPTGAGKSTVIDAICFALYGTVPRWGRENVVALALPPSAAIGRVGLIFEAGGRRYASVRVLSRDRRGRVSTREARLDELTPDGSWEEAVRSLAEGDDVTTAVQEIVGLPYKYFVQSVVVPQGRFAEFLHAPPRERQDLLVSLLDAGVYEQIRRRAAIEEEAARRAAGLARQQLGALTDADEATERRAADRHATLTALADAVRSSLTDLTRYDEELSGSRAELTTARRRLRALTALAMPEGISELADRIREAAKETDRLAAAVTEREEAEAAAEEELALLLEGAGDPADLQRIRAGHVEHARLSAARDKAENRLVEASERREAVGRHLAAADAEHAEAAAELDRVRQAHVAGDLARELVVGEPCPVCLRPVTDPPHHPVAADVTEIEWREAQAARAVSRLEDEEHEAEVAFHRLEQNHADLRAQLDTLADVLAEAPDEAVIEQRLKLIATAREHAERARAETRTARRRHDEAVRAVTALRATAGQTWQALQEARDTVAELRPPVLVGDDLALAWRTLLTWRDETVVQHGEEVEALAEAVEWTEAAAGELRASITTRLADAGLEVIADATPMDIGGAVTEAVTTARAALDRVRENRRRAAELAVTVQRTEHEAQVAGELGRLLRANNFERWLVGAAMEILIDAAAEIMRELSGGQYELALAERGEIEVVDYGEAGLRRSARTLSGGETFQAGLALALALSQRVAGFAAAAARSLDAIFLDEGFGSLDVAALDTVAATLERLAASGDRMVGIVTHVPALAERVPARFEVSRDGSGSHVRRVTPGD